MADILRVTQQELPPDGATHWSSRSLAEHLGVGKDTVARTWRNHEVKPWKFDRFKISNDPRFEEKLVDVVGLCMDPLNGRRCSVSTRRPRSRRWTARSRPCRCAPAGRAR